MRILHLFSSLLLLSPFVYSATVEDLSYEIVTNSTIFDGYLEITIENGPVIKITDCDTSSSGLLDIHYIIDGYPVSMIDRYAFKHCSLITEITIPSSVKYIGSEDFRFMNQLEKITFPNYLEHWTTGALMDNPNLLTVGVPDDFILNKNPSYIPAHFLEDSPVENFTIPSSIQSIGTNAFIGTKLKEVIIPEGVTRVNEKSFYFTGYTLDKLVIPNSLGEISYNSAFKLTTEEVWMGANIDISEYWQGIMDSYGGENSVQDSFQVTLTGKGKLVYTGDKVNQRFDSDLGINSVKEIIILSAITNEQDFNFQNFTNLESITFPESLISLNTTDFKNMPNLSSITFTGDKPTMNADIFDGISANAVINVNPDAIGFSDTFAGIPINVLYNVGPAVLNIADGYYPQLNENTLVDATPSDGFLEISLINGIKIMTPYLHSWEVLQTHLILLETLMQMEFGKW